MDKGKDKDVSSQFLTLVLITSITSLVWQIKARPNTRIEQMEVAMKKQTNYLWCRYNDKVVYAITILIWMWWDQEAILAHTGTHVAGSAVGNATKPAPTGELLKGVAPEAQLMFARVFQIRKEWLSRALSLQSCEDAVKLGADTINMSFGISGSEADTNPLTRQAFEFARKSGVVINVSRGNYAVNGYWQSQTKSRCSWYWTIDEPAIENALAIGFNKIDHVEIRLEILP